MCVIVLQLLVVKSFVFTTVTCLWQRVTKDKKSRMSVSPM